MENSAAQIWEELSAQRATTEKFADAHIRRLNETAPHLNNNLVVHVQLAACFNKYADGIEEHENITSIMKQLKESGRQVFVIDYNGDTNRYADVITDHGWKIKAFENLINESHPPSQESSKQNELFLWREGLNGAETSIISQSHLTAFQLKR